MVVSRHSGGFSSQMDLKANFTVLGGDPTGGNEFPERFWMESTQLTEKGLLHGPSSPDRNLAVLMDTRLDSLNSLNAVSRSIATPGSGHVTVPQQPRLECEP